MRRRRERTVVRVRRRGVEGQLRRDVVDDRDPHRRRVLRTSGGDVGVVVVAVENLGRGVPGGSRGDARRDEGEEEQQGRRDEQARQEHGWKEEEVEYELPVADGVVGVEEKRSGEGQM